MGILSIFDTAGNTMNTSLQAIGNTARILPYVVVGLGAILGVAIIIYAVK